jgi:hypothetical protein
VTFPPRSQPGMRGRGRRPAEMERGRLTQTRRRSRRCSSSLSASRRNAGPSSRRHHRPGQRLRPWCGCRRQRARRARRRGIPGNRVQHRRILSDDEHCARSLAIVAGGSSVAIVAGLPFGILVGQTWGWRTAHVGHARLRARRSRCSGEPLGMSRPAWTGTGTARPSRCCITWWLPVIRSTTNPALSSALTTFAPDTTGMLLGATEEATRSQATLSVRVNSSGGPTTSSRASSATRRSSIASSCVAPSPAAPTPGRSWAEAHQTPSSSCSTT